jgi:hypothetical protein
MIQNRPAMYRSRYWNGLASLLLGLPKGSSLPRYFFHIRDSIGLVRDDEGLELTGEIDAREEAWNSAADLIANAARQPAEPATDAVVVVEDEHGSVVYELPIARIIT